MGLQEIRYWYEDLELRKKLEENQSIVLIGLIAIIVFSLGLVVCQLTGGGGGSYSGEVKLVYFDVGNQAIRIVDHEYPGIPASPLEGTEDVFMATVFACEDCPKGSIKDGMTLDDLKAEGMFIGWLERHDPSMTEEMAMFGEGYQYRSIEDDKWYGQDEQAFQEIASAPYNRCQTAQVCMP